jgi:fructose-bisphosphate aldolase, class I
MNAQKLMDTTRTLFAGDKGLLAMDKSNPTCNKRFARLGIPQTQEARRTYRELIVTTLGLAECISGAILYDEGKDLSVTTSISQLTKPAA